MRCCAAVNSCDTVPDIEGKLYAATQVMDEARHVEVFNKYLNRLDKTYPMDPALKAVIDAVLAPDSWKAKCVGMQVLVESVAMGTFRTMMKASADDLLRDIVTLTARDEARHVAFGIISMNHEIPSFPKRSVSRSRILPSRRSRSCSARRHRYRRRDPRRCRHRPGRGDRRPSSRKSLKAATWR